MGSDSGTSWGAATRALRAEVRDLYESYGACLDDLELEHWPEFFTDDALYQVISRENYEQGLTHATMYCSGIGMIKDRVVAIRETTVYEPRSLRHFIGAVSAERAGEDTILARGNFAVIESMTAREPVISMVGRYIDVLEDSSGSLRFRSRSCVFDNYRIQTSLIIPI